MNQLYQYALAFAPAATTDPVAAVMVASVFAAAIAVLAGMAPSLSQGLATGRAVEAVGRQPEAAGQIRGMLIIGCVISETGGVYGLAVALILLFANPFVDGILVA
ncbi:MAG: ATP synthase Fo subunit C [Defluviitaleaceae bacterium]|nr:ATP synthase Fo subunit C [Defluviitaleaceae bacterium]